MCRKQEALDPAARDYGYIEYLRKSLINAPDCQKELVLLTIMAEENRREYYTASLRQINHLIQIGKPNLELMEPKWELYKISISFHRIREFHTVWASNFEGLKLESLLNSSVDCQKVPKLKGSEHRVFFQNAVGNINMGVLFNDPDVGLDELFWYNELAMAINISLERNEGLISIEEELNTYIVYSCYVELHRKGWNPTVE